MNSPVSKLTLFLIFFALFFSCTKIITTDIGAGLIPPVDGVTTKDTIIDVITKNTGFDTGYVGIGDDHALGYIDDPIFGKTKASVNFQIAAPFVPFSFGVSKDSIFLDSVVLCLSYHGSWGDTIPHLKLHVYKIDPEVIFDNDSAYNTVTTFEKGTELTESGVPKDVDIVKLNDADSTAYYKISIANQLRIKLDNSFGQQLINFDASQYTTDSTFYTYLRGLIVEPDENGQTGQALLRVNLLDTSTYLSLYYRKRNTSGGLDTTSTRFSPNVYTSASSNTIIRSYQDTQLPGYFSNTNTNDDQLFLQTTPGTYTTIKMPGIDSMPNVIVHRAELLMYQVPDLNSAYDNYFTAPNLFLSAFSQDSGRRFAIPYDITYYGSTISNLTQFGVAPRSQTDKISGRTTSYYNFDLSRYVQHVINKQSKSYDMILFAPYNQYILPVENTIFYYPISSPVLNAAAIGRVRLGGGSNSQYKMKLHIVYSLP